MPPLTWMPGEAPWTWPSLTRRGYQTHHRCCIRCVHSPQWPDWLCIHLLIGKMGRGWMSESFFNFFNLSIFPAGASGKEPSCQCRRHEMWIQSLGQEDSLEGEMATHSNSYLENPMDREPWQSTVHGVTQVRHDWTDLARTHTYIPFLASRHRVPAWAPCVI